MADGWIMTMDCTVSWKLVNCMACIKILEGIDTGKSFPIDQEIMLGRSANNDICLPDSRVSRQHARISLSASAFIIEDLQSSNGTLLRLITSRTAIKFALALRSWCSGRS
jgi:hypothetical protein